MDKCVSRAPFLVTTSRMLCGARSCAVHYGGKYLLARFRYHRHYFKYIVRYPYGDDATQFRTLHDEHHVRSTWVPKLALIIIILFILSTSRQESSLAFANKPTHQPTPKGRATRTSDRVCCSDLPGYSQPCSVMSWRPLHEKKVAGSEAFHTRGGKATPQTIFQSKIARALTPNHITRLGMVIGGARSS